MSSWSDWEIVHRQVALAGYIVDSRDRPVAGMHVDIIASKTTGKGKSGASNQKTGEIQPGEPIERTVSRGDGLYYFMDLPDGQFTVSIHREGHACEAHRKVSITRQKKNLSVLQTDFKLVN